MRLFRVFSFILMWLYAFSVLGQSTTVSMTVVDSAGQTWTNGTVTWQFLTNPDFPQQNYQWNGAPLAQSYYGPHVVSLDNSGAASFSLPTTSTITPSGSAWQFTFCPNASAPCTAIPIPTVGATQNISSTITPQLGAISIGATSINKTYQSGQVKITPSQGGMYFNTTLKHPFYFDGISWQDFIAAPSAGITALTGDGTATGPGSVPFTLATVNPSPGSCGDSTHTCTSAVNGKGLTTSQSSNAIDFANNALTGLTGDISATGPGVVNAVLPNVNVAPGTCGDGTHVCQSTTNAKGQVTNQSSVVITGVPITTRTCNGNGCYRVEGDGTIEQWGTLTCGSVSCAVTFPTSFTTTTNLAINVTIDYATQQNLVIVIDGTSTTGFTAIAGAVVYNGGGGSGYTGGGTYRWTAIGN